MKIHRMSHFLLKVRRVLFYTLKECLLSNFPLLCPRKAKWKLNWPIYLSFKGFSNLKFSRVWVILIRWIYKVIKGRETHLFSAKLGIPVEIILSKETWIEVGIGAERFGRGRGKGECWDSGCSSTIFAILLCFIYILMSHFKGVSQTSYLIIPFAYF